MTPEIQAACSRVLNASEEDALSFLAEDGVNIARACLAQEAELEAARTQLGAPTVQEGIKRMVDKVFTQQEDIARLTAECEEFRALLVRVSDIVADDDMFESGEDPHPPSALGWDITQALEVPKTKAIPVITPAQSEQLARDQVGLDVFLTTEQPVAEGDGMRLVIVTSEKLKAVWGSGEEVMGAVIVLDPDKCTPAERKALLSQARKTEE